MMRLLGEPAEWALWEAIHEQHLGQQKRSCVWVNPAILKGWLEVLLQLQTCSLAWEGRRYRHLWVLGRGCGRAGKRDDA